MGFVWKRSAQASAQSGRANGLLIGYLSHLLVFTQYIEQMYSICRAKPVHRTRCAQTLREQKRGKREIGFLTGKGESVPAKAVR